VGLLEYYRQFEGLSQEEVNARLREQAAERRSRELARVEPLNLSSTTWPHLPPPAVVNAVTYIARRGLHRYLDRHTNELRDELAHRLSVDRDRLVVGHGAAQLLSSAAQALMEPGDELVCPWPAYALLPVMARRARGRAVPVTGFSVDALLEAINDRTRLVALASPNDPTGEHLGPAELARLLAGLPERVVVLLDEALVEYAGPEAAPATLELLEEHPRMITFRSFSKAWGLAGLRCGYALGGPGSAPLLERLEPDLGINDLAQAGALEALRSCSELIAARVAAVERERDRLLERVRDLGYEASETRANFLWLGLAGVDGIELARRLERSSVIVAPGAPLGDPERVRAAVQERATGDRLLSALESAR
jgi:histidinol-phosphate aminotransferase